MGREVGWEIRGDGDGRGGYGDSWERYSDGRLFRISDGEVCFKVIFWGDLGLFGREHESLFLIFFVSYILLFLSDRSFKNIKQERCKHL